MLELYLAETRWAEHAEHPPALANVPRILERRAAIDRRLHDYASSS